MRRKKLPRRLTQKVAVAAGGQTVSERAKVERVTLDASLQQRAQQLIEQVDELLKKHRMTAMPAELRIELKVLTQLAIEAINLANIVAENMQFESALLEHKQLWDAFSRLDRHINDLVRRIQKRASYLKVAMPELPDRKYPIRIITTPPKFV